jgi:hypothetical protein
MRGKRAKEFRKLFLLKNKQTGEIKLDKSAYKKLKEYWKGLSIIEKMKYNKGK